MWTIWIFWLFVLVGGAVMGGAAARRLASHGLDAVVAMNALVYLGTAVFAVPRVCRLVRRRQPSSH
jgi:DMSO reductase anchor subunit